MACGQRSVKLCLIPVDLHWQGQKWGLAFETADDGFQRDRRVFVPYEVEKRVRVACETTVITPTKSVMQSGARDQNIYK